MKKNKVVYGIIVAVLVVVAAVCAVFFGKNSGDKTAVNETKTEKTAKSGDTDNTSEDEEPVKDIGNHSTLTNEESSDETMQNRVVAVMTENTKPALPQYGINDAGVIYECPMEGGLTRMMAIYDYEKYTDLERIGNVRSCRPYFAYIASEYNAIYVHYGQSVHGQAVLETGIVNNLSGLDGAVNSTFYRTSDKKAPHNAYTSGEGIAKGISNKGYEATRDASKNTHFEFADGTNTLEDGEDCTKLTINSYENKPWFQYNADSKTYARFEYGSAQVDGNTGKQKTVKNIILQFVPVGDFGDDTPYLKIPITGTGKGKFLTNGKMIDITWKKDSDTAVTHYYDAAGNEIQLNTGSTWISLVNQSYTDKNVYQAD